MSLHSSQNEVSRNARWHHGRFALLCHGFIGTMHQTPSEAIKYAIPTDLRLIVMSTQSHLKHIVRPNEVAGGVDIFVHSWNPSVATFIDARYRPTLRASLHEQVNRSLHKAQSQALSIGRAAMLMRTYERWNRHLYEMALVIRNDLVVGAPVVMERLHTGHIWFAVICCQQEPETPAQQAEAGRQCGVAKQSRRPHSMLSPCSIDRQWGMGRGGRPAEISLGYYVMDWWFAAEPRVVASWMNIATSWDLYVALLKEHSLHHALFSHYVWPVHVHDVLNLTAQIRFADLQTGLARNAHALLKRDKPLRDCPYTSLGGEAVSQQELLDAPLSKSHFDRAGLYFGYFPRRMAPFARMCPYIQRQRPVVCCNQSCGTQQCDEPTRMGLASTFQICASAVAGPRALINHSHRRRSLTPIAPSKH